MAKYYVMGNFSQKGHKGLLTGDSNRGNIVKSGCEAMGCKFISYDVTEGEFDFILVLEGDSEQIMAAKGATMMSDDFDVMISIKAVSVDSIRKNLKKMQSAYTPPSAS
jgi:uncharacterized protein with GYD domain